jgi:hypothetical protein
MLEGTTTGWTPPAPEAGLAGSGPSSLRVRPRSPWSGCRPGRPPRTHGRLRRVRQAAGRDPVLFRRIIHRKVSPSLKPMLPERRSAAGSPSPSTSTRCDRTLPVGLQEPDLPATGAAPLAQDLW